MRTLTTLVSLVSIILTACGTAQEAAKDATKTDTSTTVSKPEESSNPQAVDKPVEKKDVVVDAQKGPSELTKDQQTRAAVRIGFDSLLAKDQVFHDEAFKTYFIRGEVGTMGYPDTSYVPALTKNLLYTGCPLGFKQVGQIDLSVAKSHGLFDKLPPDADWIWTSWKAGDGYYAMAVDDLTDQWGYSFMAGMFYQKHAKRIEGRLYCMMSEADLPSVDDMPEGYLDSLRGH